MRPIIICYVCRKRVAKDELPQHNHFDEETRDLGRAGERSQQATPRY